MTTDFHSRSELYLFNVKSEQWTCNRNVRKLFMYGSNTNRALLYSSHLQRFLGCAGFPAPPPLKAWSALLLGGRKADPGMGWGQGARAQFEPKDRIATLLLSSLPLDGAPLPHWCLTNNKPEPGRWPVASSIWFGRNFCSSIELCWLRTRLPLQASLPGRWTPLAASLPAWRTVTEPELEHRSSTPPPLPAKPVLPTAQANHCRNCPPKVPKTTRSPGGHETVVPGVCPAPPSGLAVRPPPSSMSSTNSGPARLPPSR